MVHASVLKPLIQIGFLIQYYLLLSALLLKNMIVRIYYMLKNHKYDFLWHPLDSVHPHVFAHPHVLIEHQHFTFQIYEGETSDHAFVTLWRIRHQDPTKWNNQNPVLIQHGLLDCGMSWFLNEDKSQSLPFVLAQEGYDVWVGNNRGTVYSDKNSHLPNYWEFNIDHFAKYDQPALINKVLQETGKSKLIYIGHSQGSTQFLLGLAENEGLQNKIQKFFGMGAVISLQHVKDNVVLNVLSKYYLAEVLETLGFKALLIFPKGMQQKVGVLVYNFSIYVTIIINFITCLCGATVRNKIDTTRLGILVSHEPGGTSVQILKHWIQAYRNGKLRRYDYGKERNIEIYGTQIPPEYTFNHVKSFPFKSHIFRGSKNAIISDKDFQILVSHFDKDKLEVNILDDYSHLDYAWSVTAKQDLYNTIIQILKKDRQITTFSRNHSSSNTQDTSFSSREDFEQIDY